MKKKTNVLLNNEMIDIALLITIGNKQSKYFFKKIEEEGPGR